jgi:hypothetical protein
MVRRSRSQTILQVHYSLMCITIFDIYIIASLDLIFFWGGMMKETIIGFVNYILMSNDWFVINNWPVNPNENSCDI